MYIYIYIYLHVNFSIFLFILGFHIRIFNWDLKVQVITNGTENRVIIHCLFKATFTQGN